MFDLQRIPVIRALFPFACGSLAGYPGKCAVPVTELLVVALMLWLILVMIYRRSLRRAVLLPWSAHGILFMLFFLAGSGTTLLSVPRFPGLPEEEPVWVRGEVTANPKTGRNYCSFELVPVILFTRDTFFLSETLLQVYMKIPADSMMPAAGEIWQLTGKLTRIGKSGNPGAPDYASMMHRKNSWYRFYVDRSLSNPAGRCHAPASSRHRIRANLLREALWKKWRGSDEKIALLKAVCLGDRSDLSDHMLKMFTGAGGMHLLAVSGLHLGVIWWVLQHLFSWMDRLFRNRYCRGLTIIALLWIYAFVTGFSPSVSRAVTMLSIYTAGRLLSHRIHPVNTILVSAFLLILIDPLIMLNVGFQLSYTAILGIMALHPLFKTRIQAGNRLVRWLLEATGASLSAQVCTAPLVIYYFHQIPLYSLITNLIAFPVISVLMALFVLSVPAMLTGLFHPLLNDMLMAMAGLMTRIMEIIAALPGAVVSELQLERISLCLLMVSLLFLFLVVNKSSRLYRYLLAGSLFLLLLSGSLSRYNSRYSSEMVIAHFNRASMVTFREGARADHYLWQYDTTSINYMNQYIGMAWNRHLYENRVFIIDGPVAARGAVSGCIPLSSGIWYAGNDQIKGCLISGLPGEQQLIRTAAFWECFRPLRKDFMLLSGEPGDFQIPPLPLVGETDLIADGSNRRWYVERLKITRDKLYNTRQQGAFMKRW